MLPCLTKVVRANKRMQDEENPTPSRGSIAKAHIQTLPAAAAAAAAAAVPVAVAEEEEEGAPSAAAAAAAAAARRCRKRSSFFVTRKVTASRCSSLAS